MKYLKKIYVCIFSIFIKPVLCLLPSRFIGVNIDLLRILKKSKYGNFFWIFGDLSAIRFGKAYNAETLMIEFIESYMDSKSCFYDIGACLGSFSSITASKKITTVAFEANPFNIYALYENLKINAKKNNFNDIFIFPFALDSKNHIFQMNDNEVIGNAIDIKKVNSNSIKLFSLGTNFDFINKNLDIPPPTHIKIDVDGNELDVLNALHVYLNSSSLKYIHIEISVNFEAIDSILKNYKFKCIKSIGENYLYEK